MGSMNPISAVGQATTKSGPEPGPAHVAVGLSVALSNDDGDLGGRDLKEGLHGVHHLGAHLVPFRFPAHQMPRGVVEKDERDVVGRRRGRACS